MMTRCKLEEPAVFTLLPPALPWLTSAPGSVSTALTIATKLPQRRTGPRSRYGLSIHSHLFHIACVFTIACCCLNLSLNLCSQLLFLHVLLLLTVCTAADSTCCALTSCLCQCMSKPNSLHTCVFLLPCQGLHSAQWLCCHSPGMHGMRSSDCNIDSMCAYPDPESNINSCYCRSLLVHAIQLCA